MTHPVRTQYLTEGGPRLFLTELGPADATRTLIVVHGYADHGGRYIERLTPWAEAGWRILLPDLRGHGRSDGQRGAIRDWSEYLDDVNRVAALVTTPASRTAILGHSNGGLITASWLIANSSRVATAVLSSPLMGIAIVPPAWKAAAGRILSRIVPQASLPSEIKPAMVSRDPATVASYAHDPLVHHVVNARWFTEALAAMDNCFAQSARITPPTLVMQAGADQLVSASQSARFARGLPNATFEEVTDGFHELLFDLGGAEHAARMLRWLDQHVSP